MGSEQNEGTSFSPSEPKLCVNGCGFFGTAANMNLCSKCYRDLRVKEEQAASAKAAMEKSLNPKPPKPQDEQGLLPAKAIESPVGLVAAASSSQAPSGGGDQGEPRMANRCYSCNKKVGLTGFKCKCGSTFCSAHRYPEKHECGFDFKGVGRDALAKANPVIKADKVERI